MKYVKRSFYRYIGSFLAILFISYVLSFILNFLGIKPKNLLLDDTYALDMWDMPSNGINEYKFYGISGSNEYELYVYPFEMNNHYKYLLQSRGRVTYYSGGIGAMVNYPFSRLHRYSVIAHVCTSYAHSDSTSSVYVGAKSDVINRTNNKASGLIYNRTELGSNPYILVSGMPAYSHCYQENYRFDMGSDNANFMGFRLPLDGVTSGSTTTWFAIFSMEINDIGYTDSAFTGALSTIQNNITSSVSNQFTSLNNNIELNANEIAQQSITNTTNLINTITTGNSAIASNVNETNNLIKDDNIDNSSGNDFFDSISTNNHGITSIITAPLSFIQSFATESCSPISASVFGQDFTIPCMKQKEIAFLGQDFYNVIVILVNGPLVYAIATYFVKSVKRAQDPDDDRIEVVEL